MKKTSHGKGQAKRTPSRKAASQTKRGSKGDAHPSARQGRTANSPPKAPPSGSRKALTHVGGRVEFDGDERLRALLERALEVDSDETSSRPHLHGFHSYPARLHPQTARVLIEGLSEAGETVFDPFCGSGTVLLEAALAKRKAVGTDVNPLGVALARFKTERVTPEERQQWFRAAESVAEFAEERRQARAGPLKRYPQHERQLFDPHMLLELDSLRGGIADLKNRKVQEALRLVLSSLVTKVSRRSGDSSGRVGPKRLAGGFAIRMFVDRTRELIAQSEEVARLQPALRPAHAVEADARRLKPIAARSADLVVCSPPYPGVYDYFDHHRLRLSLLGLRGSRFERSEIGSKRELERQDSALDVWMDDLEAVLRSCARVLRPGRCLCAVIADVALAGQVVRGDRSMLQAGRKAGFELNAAGSQRRPTFHRKSAASFCGQRFEHLVVLRRI